MFTLNLLDLKSLGCTFCAGGVLHIEEPTSMLCPCVLTQDPLLVHPAVSQTDYLPYLLRFPLLSPSTQTPETLLI